MHKSLYEATYMCNITQSVPSYSAQYVHQYTLSLQCLLCKYALVERTLLLTAVIRDLYSLRDNYIPSHKCLLDGMGRNIVLHLMVTNDVQMITGQWYGTSVTASQIARNSPVCLTCKKNQRTPQKTKFMGPAWGPPGSCRSQMGPMLAPWTLLSGTLHNPCMMLYVHSEHTYFFNQELWGRREVEVATRGIYLNMNDLTDAKNSPGCCLAITYTGNLMHRIFTKCHIYLNGFQFHTGQQLRHTL